MNLDLSPLEYLITPADFYFELTQAKAAWNEGMKDAKVMSQKQNSK